MDYEYYYNIVPGEEPSRNNLIYTSYISKDKKVFVQHYYNNKEYHRDQNQVVDPELMEDKWNREVKYLKLMHGAFPNLVPKILDIDYNNKKIYLQIDGVDFWQRSLNGNGYDSVVSDWREQMYNIVRAHRSLGLHKYSMHPSSYFVVDGKLKSINYFFTYHKDEPEISIKDVESHIHENRQKEMRQYINILGIQWDEPQPFKLFDQLCWESFRTNYPNDFIETVKCIS